MTSGKNKLIIFVGKPGVGKSTLKKAMFSDQKMVDILPYVMKQKEGSRVPESRTIHAYRDMYKDIWKHKSGDIVLELGTNHPELNASELGKLKKKFDIEIFLCDAPKHVCRKRALKREQKFDRKALELRLERDFPNSHVKLLKKEGINFEILDMKKSLDENISVVLNLIRN